MLAPKDAEDASQHTKEKVSEAIAAMAAGMSRGDVAFVGLLCHGKKMLDMDNDEIEEKEEGLCMQARGLGLGLGLGPAALRYSQLYSYLTTSPSTLPTNPRTP